MNVLVTGGAGFIGSHVVDRFVQERHQVSVIDNLSTGKRKNVNREAVLYKTDICSSRLDRIFKRERPVVIVHLAAQMNVWRSTEDPMFDANVNILGTINLLQLSVKYGVRKIVFASSGGAVYGEQLQFPAPETHPTSPLSPYGISKLSCRSDCDIFATIIERAANPDQWKWVANSGLCVRSRCGGGGHDGLRSACEWYL